MTRAPGLVLLLFSCACGEAEAPATAAPREPGPPVAVGPLRIAAAASLTEAVTEIAAAFDATHGTTTELRFGGSSTLARQIGEGAETDVFLSADPRWVDEVVHLGLAAESGRSPFASNVLVAVVPADATATPADLATLVALPHLAVAGEDVPAGMHARTALERAGLSETAGPHLVSAVDVRSALAWAATGEADAALVYATDARVQPRVRVAFELGPETHDPIRYEAVPLGAAPSAQARDFVTFLTEPAAVAIFGERGFGRP